MKRLRVLPVLACAAALLLGTALPAEASAEPASADIYNCSTFDGGQAVVPPNTDYIEFFGWSSATKLQQRKFMRNVHVIAKIDGVKIPNADSYWIRPAVHGPFGWANFWQYTVDGMPNGHTAVLTFQLKLDHSVYDGSVTWPAGKVFSPRLQCDVTAQK